MDVTADLKAGENILAIRGINHGGAAGAVARLEMTFADGKKQLIVTDTSWLTHRDDVTGWQQLAFKTDGWEKPISVAKLGAQPWGDVLSGGGAKGTASNIEEESCPAMLNLNRYCLSEPISP